MDEGYNRRVEMEDRLNYYAGWYFFGAVTAALSNIMLDKGAKMHTPDEFIKEPVLQGVREKIEADRPLTDEEIVEQTKLYFRQKAIDKLNYDLAKIYEKKAREREKNNG